MRAVLTFRFEFRPIKIIADRLSEREKTRHALAGQKATNETTIIHVSFGASRRSIDPNETQRRRNERLAAREKETALLNAEFELFTTAKLFISAIRDTENLLLPEKNCASGLQSG